jgi:hypothetical protein
VCADFKVVFVNFDGVCNAEAFDLLLAKGCDHIAPLTLCKQKHHLKLLVYIIGKLFMLGQECGREASSCWVRRDILADSDASKLRKKLGR